MERIDFRSLNIRYFTPEEVEATGARLADVKAETIVCLDRFRHQVGLPVHLIRNGLTTGAHKAPEHPAGKAVDGYIAGLDGAGDPLTFIDLVHFAILAGFRGTGIYWNGSLYSFHFDLGRRRGWTGVKGPDGAWIYRDLFNDPRKG